MVGWLYPPLPQDIQQTVLVNTLGPLVMAKYFVPLLQRGSGLVGRQSTKPRQQHAGLLAHISARVGSITDNRLGGWYGYRTSKVTSLGFMQYIYIFIPAECGM